MGLPRARAELDAVGVDRAKPGDRRKLLEKLEHPDAAGRPVEVLHLRHLGRRREQVARAFDELVLLRRSQTGEVERLLGDRRLALLADRQQLMHLHAKDRQRRDQHQEQEADAELHRSTVA